MSTIYAFQESEATVTASGTSTGASGGSVSSTDVLIVFNSNSNKTNQITLGSVSGVGLATMVTSPTGATPFLTLTPYGTSLLNAASTTVVCFLPGSPVVGAYKTIAMWATSTTTGIQVVCTSTNVTIAATGGSSNVFTANEQIFFNQPAAYVDLVAGSTSVWMITGRSVGGLTFTTTTST